MAVKPIIFSSLVSSIVFFTLISVIEARNHEDYLKLARNGKHHLLSRHKRAVSSSSTKQNENISNYDQIDDMEPPTLPFPSNYGCWNVTDEDTNETCNILLCGALQIRVPVSNGNEIIWTGIDVPPHAEAFGYCSKKHKLDDIHFEERMYSDESSSEEDWTNEEEEEEAILLDSLETVQDDDQNSKSKRQSIMMMWTTPYANPDPPSENYNYNALALQFDLSEKGEWFLSFVFIHYFADQFPNNPFPGAEITNSIQDLNLFTTGVNSSFHCNKTINIKNNFDLRLSQLKLEPFVQDNNQFSPPGRICVSEASHMQEIESVTVPTWSIFLACSISIGLTCLGFSVFAVSLYVYLKKPTVIKYEVFENEPMTI